MTRSVAAASGPVAMASFAAFSTGLGVLIDAGLSVNRTIYRKSAATVGFGAAPHPRGVTAGLKVRW